MIPNKLKPGDEVRVIAPSRSMKIINNETREIATKRLTDLGLKVTFGKNVEICDDFTSAPVSARLEDLHDAFRDKNVKAILTVIGGFNSNQLLSGIDYELIKKNPKIHPEELWNYRKLKQPWKLFFLPWETR
jgi:muramoyltetrapeptide carboxypeptidase LdcA involved in peptidoglycan recycling